MIIDKKEVFTRNFFSPIFAHVYICVRTDLVYEKKEEACVVNSIEFYQRMFYPTLPCGQCAACYTAGIFR